MTAKELRKKYLEFFKERGHAILPPAPLIPENDPTVLFTTAGMHPLVPFLLGEKHPAGKRLASVQKCIRTGDIDEVGDNWHLTFFEMLGNWSLGDYFKEDAIKWSWEFLTDKKYLGLDPKKLAVSVFAGDADAPPDKEAYKIWRDLGVPEERVARLPKEDNWWGPAGTTGPCGPDTEMFYWAGESAAPEKFNPQDKNWVEIWNDVFMQYNKNAEGKYEPLAQKNIDTGMGLERTVGVLNNCKSVYETEFFIPIIKHINFLRKYTGNGAGFDMYGHESDPNYWKNVKAIRVVADHVRAATMILADEKNLRPSNVGQGYVLRRLIRLAVRYGKMLDINEIFTSKIAETVIKLYEDVYPEVKKNEEFIIKQLIGEEEKFGKTLENGLKEFNKFVLSKESRGKFGRIGVAYDQRILYGKDAFYLFQTFGFPKELMIELCRENNIKFDEEGFDREFGEHQELSRTASAGQFKGGLADSSDEVKRLHTAAHLMLAALKQVLGEQVEQRGSNITAERLRFDFFHPQKMTPEEIKKVEDLVNEQIQKNIPVICEITTVDEAKKRGATGIFGSKYGEKVKVYSAGDFSKEICGGPHAENTGELGIFKIIKEEASSAGIRRIKAILE
jgi:alanyl-tRNA synthetase